MKKTELVEIIRTVIREEINNSLPQFLMEVLAEKISNQTVLSEQGAAAPVKPAAAPRRNPSVALDAPLKQAPAQAPRIFSTNPALNAVLNETVGGLPLEADTGPSAMDTIANLPKQVLAENKEVAAVATALTRDYSQMMKAIDAKAKAKRI